MDLVKQVERVLLEKFNTVGHLSEDDIVDEAIEYGLSLTEIDGLCEKLLTQKVLIDDSNTNSMTSDDNEYIDKSHLDYEDILNRIAFEYPNCGNLVNQLREIRPPQTREWQSLIGQAQHGNEFAKKRLIEMYLRTVAKLAYDYSKKYCCDFEDMFQYGCLGLMNAIEKYDVTSPDSFVSYYGLWVFQYFNRYMDIPMTLMRYPVHYKEYLLPFIAKMGDNQFAYHQNNWFQEIDFSFESKIRVEHLYAWEEYPDDLLDETDDFEVLLNDLVHDLIATEISKTLSDKEYIVIKKRFGLDGSPMTLEAVGEEFNVTRERIRQIEQKALRKLKNNKTMKLLFEDWW